MAESALYPSVITTQLYQVVARKSTTLTADVDSINTTLPVTATTGFPAVCFISVNNETMLATVDDGTNFTVSRGYAGTAASHDEGDDVKLVVASATINRIVLEVIATQTYVGTSGGGMGYVNARYLNSKTEAYLVVSSATRLGGSTESQLNVGFLSGSTKGEIDAYADLYSLQSTITEGATTITPTIASQRTLQSVTNLGMTCNIAEPTGNTPSEGDVLIMQFEDDGTGRALSWDAAFEASGVDLPTTTTASKKLYVGFIYNATDSVWDAVASSEEA